MVEERGGFKLYECYIDGTFSKAKGGGDGIGCTKAGKGVKIMIMVDARGLPVAVNTGSASPHESTLAEPLFDFMVTVDFPERLIGDRAYDSDKLDATLAGLGVDMISPHRSNRKPENQTQLPARRGSSSNLLRRWPRGCRCAAWKRLLMARRAGFGKQDRTCPGLQPRRASSARINRRLAHQPANEELQLHQSPTALTICGTCP